MKTVLKSLTIICLVLATTQSILGQSDNDRAIVLQKCIDLPDLQELYPVNSDGSLKPLCILQHGVSFPVGTDVYKSGKKVRFVEKSQLSSEEIKSYFLFWKFEILQNSASVDLIFNYMGTDNQEKVFHAIIDFKRNGSEWTVSGIKTEGR